MTVKYANDLPHLTADSLGGTERIRHAFFTRNGGVSDGIYKTLNIGLGSKDEIRSVTENRRRVAGFFGLPGEALNTVYQVHGRTTVYVDGPRAVDVNRRSSMNLIDSVESFTGQTEETCHATSIFGNGAYLVL